MVYRFQRNQRITSTNEIKELFHTGKALFSYPIKVVYVSQVNDNEPNVKVAVICPKKKLRKAYQRNRAKRIIREVYRRRQYELLDWAKSNQQNLRILVIYNDMDPKILYSKVDEGMSHIFTQITR